MDRTERVNLLHGLLSSHPRGLSQDRLLRFLPAGAIVAVLSSWRTAPSHGALQTFISEHVNRKRKQDG